MIDFRDRRVQIAAGAAGVVGLALYAKHKAAASHAGTSVSAVPPGNPPVTTADLNDALGALNNAAVSLVSASNGLNAPPAATTAGTPVTATAAPAPARGPVDVFGNPASGGFTGAAPAPAASAPVFSAAPAPAPTPAQSGFPYVLSQGQYQFDRAGDVPYIQDLLSNNPVGLPAGFGYRVIAGAGDQGVSSYTQIYGDEATFGSVAGLPTPGQVAASPGAYPGIGPGRTPL